MEELLKELEELRSRWCDYASGIEMTHGDDDPAAKAFRTCNQGLCHVLESWKNAQASIKHP
jgi:hypothetical protein